MAEDGYLVLRIQDAFFLQVPQLLRFSSVCTHLLRCGPLSTHPKCSTAPISDLLVSFFHSLGLLLTRELCAVYFGGN